MWFRGDPERLAPIPKLPRPTGLSACFMAPPPPLRGGSSASALPLPPHAARASVGQDGWRGHTHYSMIEAKTGGEVDADGWREGIRRTSRLNEQSASLADALERSGISARSDNDVTLVGLVTGEMRRLESYRPIRFIPSVAQRERKKYKSALEYFLPNFRGYEYSRYWTITNGLPIYAFGDLRKAHQRRARQISKFASKARQFWGVEVIFRATEYTRKIRGNDQIHSYHLHNNLLLKPGWYDPQKWEDFLMWANDFFSGGVTDNGRVRSVEEIVKYMIKPDDLMGISDEEVAWLYHETFKARFVAPMGDFKDFFKTLTEDRLKVLRAPGAKKAKGGLVLVKKEYHPKRESPATDQERGVSMNWLGTTTAMPAFSPFCEPCALVQNLGERPATGFHETEAEWTRWARHLWDEAGAPEPEKAVALGRALMSGDNVQSISKARLKRDSYRVHTYSVTVPPEWDGNEPWDHDDPFGWNLDPDAEGGGGPTGEITERTERSEVA